MGIIKTEGLKGLKGLGSLSSEDRQSWLSANKDRLPDANRLSPAMYNKVIDRLYRNDLFRAEFNDENLFQSLTPEERDQYYANSIVDKAIQVYKDDSWFPQISNMTTEGKMALLESGFETDDEFRQSVDQLAYDKGADGTDHSFWTEFALAMSKPQGMAGMSAKAINKEMSSKTEEGMTTSRNGKFQAFLGEDNLRKIEQSADVSNQYLSNLQRGIDEGKISYEDVEADFDKFIGETSNHYKAFKDSDIFENFTVSDKMRYLSEFMGVANKFGVESAVSAINTKMQNFVSDEQSAWDWAGNTTKALGTKFVAELMNTVTGAVAGYKAVEDAVTGGNALGNYLQGKDEEGNDLPAWYNPLYYQGMDQYNLWTVDAINEARQNGGISDAMNITRAGEEMDFLSWKTLNEAIGQLGYMGSIMFKTAVLSGTGGMLTKMAPALRVSRLAQTAGTALELGASVAGMSEMEGLSSFQETLQQANEMIDSRIDQDARSYVEQQMGTDEAKLRVQNEIMKLKDLYSNKELYGNKIVSPEYLVNEATKNVANELYNEYKISNDHLYNEDRDKALESATMAYMTTATLFAAKEATTNGLFQKFLFSKGTRKALGDNGPKAVYRTNPDGTMTATVSKWQLYGKPLLQQPIVEALEEASDSYVNNLGQGLGLNEYNSYHQKKYNPDAYVAITDNLVGNILSGITRANKSMLTIDPWYEGFIAAISGVGGAAVDIYHNTQAKKYIQDDVARINEIIKERGSILNDATAALTMINDSREASVRGDLLSSIDAKQSKAFEIIRTLDVLGRSEAGRQSDLYTGTMNILNSLSDGTISDEQLNTLVGQFLGQGSNKSVAEDLDARNTAAQLLKENAEYLLGTQESLNELNYILDNSPNRDLLTEEVRAELGYLKVMQRGWESRLKEIESDLGIHTSSTYSADAEYGSKKAYERKKKALADTIASMKKRLSRAKDSLEFDDFEGNEEKAMKLKVKALKSAIKKAESDYKRIEKEAKLFEDNEYSRTLSSEEILSLPAEQRAWILDPKNLSDYSTEQQLIIEELRSNLTTKDPASLQKISDAAVLADRVSTANTAFSRIVDNPIEAANYIKELERQRTSKVRSLYQQKAKERVEELFQGVSDEEAKTIARDLPYTAVDDYIADHPEMEDVLRGVSEVSRFRQDADFISDRLLSDADDNTRSAIKQSILNITSDSNNEEEAINAIEDAIDSNSVDAQTKDILDTMLNELQELNYQRNSTKVSDREAKKERQAARERAAEEAVKRQEEAERLAKEEARSKEREVPKDGSSLMPETMDDSGISPDGSNIQETVEVDETKVGSEEQLVGAEDVDLIDRVESPTPEEQSKDNPKIKEVQVTSTPEEAANTSSVILVGNAMYRYEGAPLKEDGYQVKRAGRQEGDPMNKFFNWMDNAGINYQEIVDNELHSILAVNPKIQFLLVNPQDNATNDSDMNDHVLEVVEYTPQVAKVHKESNGGVVTANGKRWLVVGTLGFGRYSSEQRKVYGDLKYELKKRRYQYTKANPNERFYVDPFYSTEVAKLDAGWVTRKLAGDTEVKIRSIRELLSDESRNPRGLALEDLKWGIQSDSEFRAVGVSSRNKVHPPKDTLGNSGGAFLLVESANGEYIPIALKPVMYGELRDSRLKTEIDNLLVELTSPNHTERHAAISKLVQLLYLKENNILIGTKDKNTLSITKGDVVIKTFDLNDPTFNRMEFLENVTALNPRVNVTLTALSSPTTLEMLDEAGVLLTDAAKLGTSNASFSVYNVGPDGKPIINAPIENDAPSVSDLRKIESSVLVLGQVYRKRKDGWVDAVDRVITDPRMLEQIKYNNIIQASNLSPVATKDNQEYFIISQDMSNPVAVKRAVGTNTVTVASKEQALALIEQMAKKAAEKKAAEALSRATLDESSLEDVSLGEEVMTQEDIYGQMFGEFVVEGDVTLDEEVSEETASVVVEDINTTGTKSLAELQTGKELSTLGDILGHSEYGKQLDDILDEKAMSDEWPDIPDDIKLLGSYLRKKGIATSGITDVESWLNMIKDCK